MRQPTFAPAFVAMYPALCELARDRGYALMVHGTASLDFDLLAVPWTNEACEPLELVTAVAQRMHLLHGDFGTGMSEPELKPHGRISWLLEIGCGACLDFGVMPRR